MMVRGILVDRKSGSDGAASVLAPNRLDSNSVGREDSDAAAILGHVVETPPFDRMRIETVAGIVNGKTGVGAVAVDFDAIRTRGVTIDVSDEFADDQLDFVRGFDGASVRKVLRNLSTQAREFTCSLVRIPAPTHAGILPSSVFSKHHSFTGDARGG